MGDNDGPLGDGRILQPLVYPALNALEALGPRCLQIPVPLAGIELGMSEPQIAQAGIGRKFQKPTVYEALTVFENLELALKTDKGVPSSMFFRLDSAQSDRLAELLGTIHLAEPFDPERKENDRLDLQRIALPFSKHGYGELRELIDVCNTFVD